MARTLTNNMSLAYAVEASVGTLPGSPTWKLLEPNDLGAYGATITTVARRPISKNRQKQKGAVTDLDSTVEFEADLTMDSFADFAAVFTFAEPTNTNVFFRAANVGAGGYTITAATPSQAAKLQWVTSAQASLVWAQGYVNAANNGLKVLTADTGSGGTTIAFSGAVVETAPANATVEIAGIRSPSGDLAITVAGASATMTSAAAINFTTLGLTVGQFIHIGGTTTTNQFTNGKGYARVVTIAAATLTLDKVTGTLVTDANTATPKAVDILFGRFIRNVAVDAAATDNQYFEKSLQFEAAFADLASVGTPEYEYAKGNYCNEMTFNLPLADKATLGLGFIGTDTEVPTTTRKTNAATPLTPVLRTAFSTAGDIVSLRTSAVAASDTCFKSVTLTLNNNVSAEKCLGTLGATYMNAGIFEVMVEAQMLYTDGAIINAIRNNTTVTMDFILKNENGAIAVDLPAMTLGGGDREFPADESVLVNLTGEAFADPTLNTSIGFSLFPVVPS